MRTRNWKWTSVLGSIMLMTPPAQSSSQEPQQAPSSQATAPAAPGHPQSTSEEAKKKYSHASDFLIRGTVFNEKGLALPGAQLRIRRGREKKFRWESYTNSRGEFAMRVPQGADYEIFVQSKNFGAQTRTVDAATGAHEEDLVFRMEPAGDKK